MSEIDTPILEIKKLVVKDDTYEQVVFGEVFAPFRADSQGDAMTDVEIKKAAYNFMKNMRLDNIDVGHNLQKSGSYVVESFIVRHDNDPDGFIKGAWVLGVKVEDKDLWNSILKGEVNGFSLYGRVPPDKVPNKKTVKIQKVTEIKGLTEKSLFGMLPEHTHEFHIKFDDFNRIIPTETNYALGHTHMILQGTSTEESLEHSHRFSLSE